MQVLNEITEYLYSLGDEEIASHSQKFFKTSKGEYGYGDLFLGIRVPVIRKVVKKYKDVDIEVIEELLSSRYHEIRLFSILWLVNKFPKEQSKIYNLYLKSISMYVNNWDLVDSSAAHIVGAYLHDKDRNILYELVKSNSLWERRVSIIATFYFIRKNQFEDTLKISKLLLSDREDLIHKAVGWMLREVGKRDLELLLKFLDENYKIMPRVMLRYSIEKLSRDQRVYYLYNDV